MFLRLPAPAEATRSQRVDKTPSRRISLVLAGCLSIGCLAVSLAQTADRAESKVAEFCKRAKALDPGDAEAQFEFARWCAASGFPQDAERYYRECLAIDADHAEARRALGFVRYGTGWVPAKQLEGRNKKKRSRPGPRTGDTSEASPDGGTTAAAAVADPAAVAEKSGTASDDSDGADDSSSTAAVENRNDEALARKRQWAEDVAGKLQTELATWEDDDFLVHTTLASVRDPRFKALVKHLKECKKLIAGYIGVRSSDGPMWPSKEQFILVRSEQQFEQFGELIDDVDYAKNDDGAYSTEDHTVLWEPDSFHICRRLSETALDGAYDPTRAVSWWVRVGISERLEALLKKSRGRTAREKAKYGRAYATAAADLEQNEEINLFWLLESRELKGRDRKRGEALSMTFVDFLQRSSKSGFQKLIRKLKGSDAPALPEEGDEDAEKTYWLNYFAFQEKSLKEVYRRDPERLDKAWRAWVRKEASRLNVAPDEGRQNRGRNRN